VKLRFCQTLSNRLLKLNDLLRLWVQLLDLIFFQRGFIKRRRIANLRTPFFAVYKFRLFSCFHQRLDPLYELNIRILHQVGLLDIFVNYIRDSCISFFTDCPSIVFILILWCRLFKIIKFVQL
jgi:hypothetical protein